MTVVFIDRPGHKWICGCFENENKADAYAKRIQFPYCKPHIKKEEVDIKFPFHILKDFVKGENVFHFFQTEKEMWSKVNKSNATSNVFIVKKEFSANVPGIDDTMKLPHCLITEEMIADKKLIISEKYEKYQ